MVKEINSSFSHRTPLERLRLFIAPSLMSFLVCLLLVIATAFTVLISYNAKTGSIYRYLFGADSSAALIESANSAYSGFKDSLLNSTWLNSIIWFLLWGLFGLFVYTLIGMAISALKSLKSGINELEYVHTDKKKWFEFYGLQVVAHTIVVILFVLYCHVFFKLIVPFCLLSLKLGFSAASHLNGWFYGLLGALTLWLSLHVFTIFLRIFLLRYRVLGNIVE